MTEKKQRFENRLDKNNIKFNTLNPVWDNWQETALNVFEMIDLMNEQSDELVEYCNFSLHDLLDKKNKEIEQLKNDYDTLKLQDKDRYEYCNELKKENDRLKSALGRYGMELCKKAEEILND